MGAGERSGNSFNSSLARLPFLAAWDYTSASSECGEFVKHNKELCVPRLATADRVITWFLSLLWKCNHILRETSQDKVHL